jgi:hypothetical protein
LTHSGSDLYGVRGNRRRRTRIAHRGEARPFTRGTLEDLVLAIELTEFDDPEKDREEDDGDEGELDGCCATFVFLTVDLSREGDHAEFRWLEDIP